MGHYGRYEYSKGALDFLKLLAGPQPQRFEEKKYKGSHLRRWAASEMKIDDLGELYDSRPLAWKIEQLLRLLEARKERADRLSNRRDLWDNDTSHVEIEAKRASVIDTRMAFLNKHSKLGSARDVLDDDIVRSETQGFRESANQFEVRVAARLHDIWREARGKDPENPEMFLPRIKEINGEVQDIANTSFEQLHSYFKLENLLSAHCACEAIRNAHAEIGDPDGLKKYIRNEAFTAMVGEELHIAWLKRNGGRDWVTDQQRLPYGELSEEEREKDNVIVREAVNIYIRKMESLRSSRNIT